MRDDFDKETLNLFWYFLRNPYEKDRSLTARPGYLRLNGSALSFKQNDSPAFVCRRQTALGMNASAKIDFTPVAENEEAGLVIRGNDKNHYDLLSRRALDLVPIHVRAKEVGSFPLLCRRFRL